MSNLPLTVMPSSTVELPVLGKTIRVRAMTIREEKNLLTAKDAGNTEDIEFCISELIKECSYNKVSPDELTEPDIIALFLKIVELSKGPCVTHTYICHNKTDEGKECLNRINVMVDLRNVKFSGCAKTNLVKIQDNITLELVYPTNEIFKKAAESSKTEIETQLKVYAYSVKSIMQGDDIYTEYTDDEIYEWFLGLNEDSLKKVADFFNTIPKATLTYDIVCPKCGYKETVTLTRISDFFTQDTQETLS